MNKTPLNLTRSQVLRRVFEKWGMEVGTLPLLPQDSLRFARSDPRDRGLPPEAGDTPCTVKPEHFGIGGLVWGAAGSGKSRFLHVLAEEARSLSNVALLDPKGETFQLMALHAAWQHVSIESASLRDLHASSYYVNDVRRDAITPANLYALAGDMTPEVLAQIRTATALQAFGGEWSELMAYGVELLFRTVIDLGTVGVTADLVRAFFHDRALRETQILKRLRNPHLQASVGALETTLPEMTRQAITRRFEVLLASRAARVIYGLSPAAFRTLLPNPPGREVRLENFGPSLLRPPQVALSQAMNGLIDAITAVMMREKREEELLIIEEAAQLVHNPTVARYLLDASRTLRWRGLTLVACAQDPTNAFPSEVLRTLALNARWFAAFQCAKEDVALLEPYLPTDPYAMWVNFVLSRDRDDITKETIVRRILTLPRQHFVLYLKGQSQFVVRTRTVEDPMRWTGMSREDLLRVFFDEIASRSMARYDDAERLITDETRALLGAAPSTIPSQSLSIDDLFHHLGGTPDPSQVSLEEVR